ncbi:glycosyl hydrolase family 8 [Alteromonas sp. C1M14]|uniref:glycosyl hydrolase family 8 n=1 Tax=Alteromonas sp. C1M14 TaxID=2841567 RepID=UPI001C0967C4|nr:glycosyl hydrolase family 8 [Alteromonas sp. C1M14]MBU2979249.1 endoglucanase [Alteromonas sp. C1M14]
MVNTLLKWLTLVSAMVLSSCAKPDNSAFVEAFVAYKALFVNGGRVIDDGNEGVSHSEGQGYGMLFAVAANDKATFDALWLWTKSTLQKEDGLFSWRYRPCPSKDRACIDDTNNASDGELLISWALLRAADKWQDNAYKAEAKHIIHGVEQHLLVSADGYTLLLPGQYGFDDSDAAPPRTNVQLNLSYWVFPAILAIKKHTEHAPRWQALFDSGIALIKEAQFSVYQLPPDWLRFEHGLVTLDNVVSADYGFNAVRIPLHLAWAGKALEAPEQAQLLAPFYAWWRQEFVPATLDLTTQQGAEYEMSAGMSAVAEAVLSLTQEHAPQWPEVNRTMDYYSASLTLLSMLAVADSQ